MAYTYTKVGTITSSNINYDVYIKYQLTQNVTALKTTVIVALSVKRQLASSSPAKFADQLFHQSSIWGYTSKKTVTVPYTTDYVDIIAKQADIYHSADGRYNEGNGLTISYKWGAFDKAINSKITIAIPSFNVVEKIASCPGIPYNSNDGKVNITSYSKGLYTCTLQYHFGDDDWTDYYSWSTSDRSEQSINISPSLSVFGGNDYTTLYLKLITYSGSTVIGYDTKNVYFYAGTNLKPTATYTFNVYNSGSVSIDSLCGSDYASENVIPGVSSYQMALTATAVSGTTISSYTFCDFIPSDLNSYHETKQTSSSYIYANTYSNSFCAHCTDNNSRQSTDIGPSSLTLQSSYKEPSCKISEVYMDANGVVHITIYRSATFETYGTLTNKGYMQIKYKLHSDTTWSQGMNETEFDSNGYVSYTFPLTTANTYDVKVMVRDSFYQARGTTEDKQYYIDSEEYIGLKPIIQFDNTEIDLNKKTNISGNAIVSGNVTATGSMTANGSVTSDADGTPVAMGSGNIKFNNYALLSLLNTSDLQVGMSGHTNQFIGTNKFLGSPTILSDTGGTQSSLLNSGYCRLSNNLLLQWKREEVTCDSSGNYSITMPYPATSTVTPLWYMCTKAYTYNGRDYWVTTDSCTNNTITGSIVNMSDGHKVTSAVTSYVFALWIGY